MYYYCYRVRLKGSEHTIVINITVQNCALICSELIPYLTVIPCCYSINIILLYYYLLLYYLCIVSKYTTRCCWLLLIVFDCCFWLLFIVVDDSEEEEGEEWDEVWKWMKSWKNVVINEISLLNLALLRALYQVS